MTRGGFRTWEGFLFGEGMDSDSIQESSEEIYNKLKDLNLSYTDLVARKNEAISETQNIALRKTYISADIFCFSFTGLPNIKLLAQNLESEYKKQEWGLIQKRYFDSGIPDQWWDVTTAYYKLKEHYKKKRESYEQEIKQMESIKKGLDAKFNNLRLTIDAIDKLMEENKFQKETLLTKLSRLTDNEKDILKKDTIRIYEFVMGFDSKSNFNRNIKTVANYLGLDNVEDLKDSFKTWRAEEKKKKNNNN